MLVRWARSLGRVRLVFVVLSLGAVGSFAEAATPSQTKQSAAKERAEGPKRKVLYSARLSRARRAKLAQARAKARAAARQMAEVAQPAYKVDASGAIVPDVRAEAAIIYNPETNQILWEENAQNQRPIASITKVMTATVFLEDNPDLTQSILIERSDVYGASTTYLRARDRLAADDLLHLLLIASDNAAARALARASAGGTAAFIRRMNEKAIELGLVNTSYADPSGLDPANVSSAYDMARLIAFASSDERIAGIMRLPEYVIRTSKRVINIHSTNQLVRLGDVDVRGGKTGFIRSAGYCLATLLRLPQTGQQVAVVVLGARSNAGRFMETRHLFDWLATRAQGLFAPAQPQPSFSRSGP